MGSSGSLQTGGLNACQIQRPPVKIYIPAIDHVYRLGR